METVSESQKKGTGAALKHQPGNYHDAFNKQVSSLPRSLIDSPTPASLPHPATVFRRLQDLRMSPSRKSADDALDDGSRDIAESLASSVLKTPLKTPLSKTGHSTLAGTLHFASQPTSPKLRFQVCSPEMHGSVILKSPTARITLSSVSPRNARVSSLAAVPEQAAGFEMKENVDPNVSADPCETFEIRFGEMDFYGYCQAAFPVSGKNSGLSRLPLSCSFEHNTDTFPFIKRVC